MEARTCLCAGVCGLAFMMAAVPAAGESAKNVILMVADGAGFNTWDATSYYQHGVLGAQPYDQAGWVTYGCSTYPLNLSSSPTGSTTQDSTIVYDATKAWSTTPQAVQGGGTGAFAGYNFLKTTYTDSAAAASALASGQKTYNNAINWSNTNQALTGQTIAEIAKACGKSVGVVTSVEWSHATPAGLGGAHNVSRNNYSAIANEMLNAPYLDVIMGAGSPEYNDNGSAATMTTQYVGGSTTWSQLKAGTHPAGWTLVRNKADFEALTTGPTPAKVVGTANVATTLQQARSGYSSTDTPFSDAFNSGVPTLQTMTRAALNILDNDTDGMFLMIEGGAVDWANHSGQGARMIEEKLDFDAAVFAIEEWVGANSSWDETLLILTADHETGMLWGPNSSTTAFDPLVNQGTGLMPGMKYNYGSHTNSLVPLYARGAGTGLLASLVDGTDPVRGLYVDNTDIFGVMHAVVPEPASVLLGLAGLIMMRRARKALPVG